VGYPQNFDDGLFSQCLNLGFGVTFGSYYNHINMLIVTSDKLVGVTFLGISNYISGRRVRTPELVGVTSLKIVFLSAVTLLG